MTDTPKDDLIERLENKIAQLRRLVDSQTGGDALVLVQRQLFNSIVGDLVKAARALRASDASLRAEAALKARMEDAERMAALADRFLGEEQAKSKSLEANLRAVQTELARLQDKQSRATIAAKMGEGWQMEPDEAMVERAARAVLRKRHPATPEKDMWLDPVVVEEARAALSASPRRGGWQGMETALRFDDGSEIVIASYSGGGSAEGMFGQLSLMKTLADGTTLFRRYQAIDDWLDVDNLTFTAAPTQGGGE